LLGDISGLSIVHLQCHIGTDTLSLARLGAKSVVGLDFSPAAVAAGNHLAANAAGGEKLSFVESNVENACDVLEQGSFDMVYTGIGALCWIPEIRPWAATVAKLLKPGGRLFIREGHPVLWAIDDVTFNTPTLALPYFEVAEATVWEAEGTYVALEEGKKLANKKTLVFNHGLGEILQACIESGLEVMGLVEHRTVPWNALAGQMMRAEEEEEWEMKDEKYRACVPLTYTLQAVKKAQVVASWI
jgi:SAM-dependent methyltransferase